MRSATICFLLLLCSVLAFGQQPQWAVVANVVLFSQVQAIPQTTIFTPTEPGIYRLTLYFSGGGGREGYREEVFEADLNGVDISGEAISYSPQVRCGTPIINSVSPIVSLKPQQPLTYDVTAFVYNAACQYNLAITVERLM
jgi:hypothetical protein